MIEIQNVVPVDKGSCLASCDVFIKPWFMKLRGVRIFQKGDNRWLGMPSRKWEKDGEEKWEELIIFTDEGFAKRFRRQVLDAVDVYLEQNPEMKPEPAVTEDMDLPF